MSIRVAVLVDGGFFLKRHTICYGKGKTPFAVVEDLIQSVKRHAKDKYLHRVLYYDCVPFDGTAHNPVSKTHVNFADTEVARFRKELFEELKKRRKVALRLGTIKSTGEWAISSYATKKLLGGKLELRDLAAKDIRLEMRQKGIDMKIGLDIASLAYKRSVEQLVLISGDSDLVPALKLARREGIDVVLDPMWNHIESGLWEHVDGVYCFCPKPKSAEGRTQPDTKD